ncbi:MAG: 30S ribosomal protein S15 [Verrucomicrobiales bacterium]|nr:30S ribosomal protein S15 [Verrucomicrobiales bacterium]
MQAASKAQSIKEFARHEKDTGSPDVQVALLTRRINHLTEHLKANAKDFSSRRGLLMLVGKRRRLLDYVGRIDNDRYSALAKKLGLRK